MLHLTPYNRNTSIFSLFDEFERSFFDNAFGNLRENSTFRTDIREKEDGYLLEAELPGFGRENISIDLNGDMLTVSATQEQTGEQKDEAGSYVRRERRYGSFQRSFDVSGVDTDGIKADYDNGVLQLYLPKKRAAQPEGRRIEIGGGEKRPFLEESKEPA